MSYSHHTRHLEDVDEAGDVDVEEDGEAGPHRLVAAEDAQGRAKGRAKGRALSLMDRTRQMRYDTYSTTKMLNNAKNIFFKLGKTILSTKLLLFKENNLLFFRNNFKLFISSEKPKKSNKMVTLSRGFLKSYLLIFLS
jgi:hypothetical protein